MEVVNVTLTVWLEGRHILAHLIHTPLGLLSFDEKLSVSVHELFLPKARTSSKTGVTCLPTFLERMLFGLCVRSSSRLVCL